MSYQAGMIGIPGYPNDTPHLRCDSCGLRLNIRTGQYADALIAIWDGKSRGTKNMIEEMKKLGKPVRVFEAARGGGK
jgi:hypothetical protein